MTKPLTITVTDIAELSLSLPPDLRRQAGIKAGDELEMRISGGIVIFIPKMPTAEDEYTPEQRRVIDARLAKADEDIRKCRTYGPFNSADEMIASMKAELKKRAGAKKPKRPR